MTNRTLLLHPIPNCRDNSNPLNYPPLRYFPISLKLKLYKIIANEIHEQINKPNHSESTDKLYLFPPTPNPIQKETCLTIVGWNKKKI